MYYLPSSAFPPLLRKKLELSKSCGEPVDRDVRLMDSPNIRLELAPQTSLYTSGVSKFNLGLKSCLNVWATIKLMQYYEEPRDAFDFPTTLLPKFLTE
jgi:hypothetical protein